MSSLRLVSRCPLSLGAAALAVPLLTLGWLSLGCEDVGKKSAGLAGANVAFIATAAREDVAQVRGGLPEGAKLLSDLFKASKPEAPGAEAAREALTKTREKVQDLRFAKSTFFAVTLPDGQVVRNDRDQDLMAGKNLFQFFPALKSDKGYVEARGSMPEASGVRGRADGQWVAAAPVLLESAVVGYYASGWSWSSYAFRLETGLRSEILTGAETGDKVPLLYVFVIVDKAVYGAPVSPTVNAEAIAKLEPLTHVTGTAPWTTSLEIDHRAFGLAVTKLPELGAGVALAVLRSET